VGLVQRHLEASGISTVTLSWMPDMTRRVGVPRLAGISYPLSRPLGRPHDTEGQRAVLRATLALLESATGPDHYVELPFEWPETVAQARNVSKDVPPAPIAALLLKQPWLIPNLYMGRIPA
jgi:D-proline reductase (dithiol) PrdB